MSILTTIKNTDKVLKIFSRKIGRGLDENHNGIILTDNIEESKLIINKAKKLFIDSGDFWGYNFSVTSTEEYCDKNKKTLKKYAFTINFRSGETLTISNISSNKDYNDFNNSEYSFIVLDYELINSHYDLYMSIRSCLVNNDEIIELRIE